MASFQSHFSQIPLCTLELDPTYHPLFLITNEAGVHQTIEYLETSSMIGNTMLGVSGFFLLNMAAARGQKLPEADRKEIETIILIDRAQSVEKFWDRVKVIIKAASNKEEFCTRLYRSLSENCKDYWGNNLEDAEKIAENFKIGVELEIQQRVSWLSSDESFERIQKIFKEDHFVYLRIDLVDEKSTEALGSALEKTASVVDVIYGSNVHEHITQRDSEDRELIKEREISFFKGIETLSRDGTRIIYSPTRECPDFTCPKSLRAFEYNREIPIKSLWTTRPIKACQTHRFNFHKLRDHLSGIF